MSKITKYVGLDVHKDSISIAVAEAGRSKPQFLKRIPGDNGRLLKVLRTLGPLESLHCAYEAGPTGYPLYRLLTEKGVRCEVVAPSEIPMKKGKRVKTDRIDAISLAHHLRAGNLVSVCVPDEEIEAMRDLVRARDDVKIVEKSAKHRLSKFLLRHGRSYPGKTNWTNMHLDWIRKQRFEREAQECVLREYLHAVVQQGEQLERLGDALARLVEGCKLEPLIKALQAMRGIKLLTASSLAFELIDLKRFATAPKLMSYVGLVPSEDSSGGRRRQGSITKAGNKRVRTLLTEAAWNCRFKPQRTVHLRKRQEGISREVKDIAWKAQERLHQRYKSLSARGKPHQCLITAMARELVGFIWAIGQQDKLLAV
ncbi:MAG: transposase [Gammaproteobacteria bacterium]|jgi:transposase